MLNTQCFYHPSTPLLAECHFTSHKRQLWHPESQVSWSKGAFNGQHNFSPAKLGGLAAWSLAESPTPMHGIKRIYSMEWMLTHLAFSHHNCGGGSICHQWNQALLDSLAYKFSNAKCIQSHIWEYIGLCKLLRHHRRSMRLSDRRGSSTDLGRLTSGWNVSALHPASQSCWRSLFLDK